MPKLIIALVSGVIFGLGLAISGMINPAKVLNFLDFAGIPKGNWDASLAFVMAGGVAVMAVFWLIGRTRREPLVEEKFYAPTKKDIDGKLVGGSALFGAGWGLAGFCPGPALASLSLLNVYVLIFVGAMLAGSVAARIVGNRL